jgi:hypothetical protein
MRCGNFKVRRCDGVGVVLPFILRPTSVNRLLEDRQQSLLFIRLEKPEYGIVQPVLTYLPPLDSRLPCRAACRSYRRAECHLERLIVAGALLRPSSQSAISNGRIEDAGRPPNLLINQYTLGGSRRRHCYAASAPAQLCHGLVAAYWRSAILTGFTASSPIVWDAAGSGKR